MSETQDAKIDQAKIDHAKIEHAKIDHTIANRTMPLTPMALGLGGLLPFVGLAIGLATRHGFGVSPAALDQALVAYAAIIISFLGGIRWGLALRGRHPMAYGLSIVPSLVAWALLAAPEPWRLAGLGAFILILGPIDLTLVASGAAPAWFGRLRLGLSGVAAAALLSAAYSLR